MKTDSLDVSGTLYVQRVSSLPSWTAEDEGRVVYALNSRKFYVGSNTTWVELGASTPYVLPEPLVIPNLQVTQNMIMTGNNTRYASLRNLKIITYTTGYDPIYLNEQLFEITGPQVYSLLRSCLATPTNLKSLWWIGSTLSGTSVKDLVGGHDASYTDSSFFYGGGSLYNIEGEVSNKGMIKAVSIGSGNPFRLLNCGDSDDFSFTTGSADMDFTIGYVSYNSLSGLSKYYWNQALFTGYTEWVLGHYVSGGSTIPFLRVHSSQYDYKGRSVGAGILYSNKWNIVIGTYSSGSLAIYHNGIRVDDTIDNSGSYNRMTNQTYPVVSGPGYGGSMIAGPVGGMFIIKNEALSATSIRTISDFILALGKTY